VKIRVVFVGYNRPEFFRQTMESWAPVLTNSPYDPVLFLEPSPRQTEMADIFAPFGQVRVNDHVLGINVNNWHAISCVLDEDPTVDAVVLAEDDVVVSDDVMAYFEWALNTYRADAEIMTVGAFESLARLDGLPDNAVVRHAWFWPWVWGTWRNRWDRFLRGQWSFDPEVQGWDDQVWRVMDSNGRKSIIPIGSRADHIGTTGVHMLPGLMEGTRGRDFVARRSVRHLVFEELPAAAAFWPVLGAGGELYDGAGLGAVGC